MDTRKLIPLAALALVTVAACLRPSTLLVLSPDPTVVVAPDDNSVMWGGCSFGAIRAGACSPIPPPPHTGPNHTPGNRRYSAVFPSTANTYVSVANWYIDHMGIAPCAADTNDGQSATCTTPGHGPLRNYTEIAALWGTYNPNLQQTTSIHFLSDDNDTSGLSPIDPIIFYGVSGSNTANGAIIQFQGDGNGDLICSGTLGTVTPKARASNQLLSVASISNCGPPNLGFGDKIYNSTHSSIAWIEQISNPSAAPYTISQPFAALTYPPPTSLIIPTEVDTWATGDAVSVYEPWAARFVYVDPKYARTNGNSVPTTIYNLSNGGKLDFNAFRIPSVVNGTNWMESASQRFLTVDPSLGSASATGFYNSVTDDLWGGKFFTFAANSGTNAFRFVGGYIGQATMVLSPQSFFDGDVIFPGTTFLYGTGQLGQVAILSSTATNYGTGVMLDGDFLMVAKNWSGPNLYGTGTLSIGCSGHVAYPGLTATSWLQLTSSVNIGKGTVACNGTPTSAFGSSLTPVCGLTVNATNLSAAATQTVGGNTTLVANSSAVTFASAVTLASGQPMTFSTQTGVVYYSASATSASTSATLSNEYTGGATTTAVTTTTNTGFGDNAWTPGCGSIGTVGP